jgi:hypothetical protein
MVRHLAAFGAIGSPASAARLSSPRAVDTYIGARYATCGGMSHSVIFHVDRPERMGRAHVLIRLLLLAALGVIGCSSVYWLLYLSLPAVAALLISQRNEGAAYLAEDGPKITRVLRFFAGAYAYLWMLTDRFPGAEDGGAVRFEVTPSGTPTVQSALLKLITSLPALFLLAIFSFVAGILWVIAALAVLFVKRVPEGVADFLAMTLRYQFRLCAYHFSLVAEYPSLSDDPVTYTASGPTF